MVNVAEINIWDTFVGAVRWDESQRLAFFQYDEAFQKTGWELSPIKMPLQQGNRIFSFPELRRGRGETEDTFKGLPGLLADVLPDKYGNNLINTWLAKHGRPQNSMNPVEQLCFIGTRGMGALEFEPAQPQSPEKSFDIELNSLIDVAVKMLNDRETFLTRISQEEEKAMIDILKIGTSAGGARPKAVIAYNPKTGEIRSGQGKIPAHFEHWLIKLDGVSGEQFGESSGWGRIEYAYYLMAKDCQIEMNECRLLEENGRAHFMTKRFDRDENTKHHIQSLCGIRHFDFNDMFGYSYEQVFETMRMLRLSYPEAEQMFRRMVFNVLATNYDDHTKNFSFIMKKDENWRLAPAYDLCYSYDPHNHWVSQQTLSIGGKRTGITKTDILSIADQNNIKKANKIYDDIYRIISGWSKYAEAAHVNEILSKRISNTLNVNK